MKMGLRAVKSASKVERNVVMIATEKNASEEITYNNVMEVF